jgi:hypothetical protein
MQDRKKKPATEAPEKAPSLKMKKPTPKPRKKAAAKPARKAPARKPKAAPAPAPADQPEEEVIVRMGRPIKYTPAICQRMVDFFNIPVHSIEEVSIPAKKPGDAPQVELVKVLNTFPTLTRFAANEGLTRETLHDWATKKNKDGSLRYPDFSYAYARAKDLQEALMTEGGLMGAYEGRFATFAAKNILGWVDKVEQTIEQNITTTNKAELDAKYEAGMEKARLQREAMLARRAQASMESDGE